MNILNRTISLALLLSSPALLADTEFEDSVPLEVVMQFFSNGPFGGEPRLYSDILADFPPFIVPAGFRVLASTDQTYVRRVFLATGLEATQAGDALAGAFTEAGWAELPQYGAPQMGFVTTNSPAYATQLCHDEHGMLSFVVNPGATTRYVSVNHNVVMQMPGRVEPACAQLTGAALNDPNTGGIAGGFRARMLSQYAPRMIMPASNQPITPGPRIVDSVGFGSSGDADAWETYGVLVLDWSIREVFEHFADQVDEQGWAIDIEAIGAVVASASWTKTIEDMNLIGTLTILPQAENTWELRFRLVRVD